LAAPDSIEAELRAAVERILHRAVRSVMSAADPSNDLQAHAFVLVPTDAEGRRRPCICGTGARC
jgi:hypothetical protein